MKTYQIQYTLEPLKLIRIDEDVNKKISESGIPKGVVHLSTDDKNAIISTIEFEPGLTHTDFPRYYSRFLNDDSELVKRFKSKSVKNQLSFPVNLGKLVIGDFQQIFLFSRSGGNIKLNIAIEESPYILGLESVYSYRELEHFDITDLITKSIKGIETGYITLNTPDSTAIVILLKPEEISKFKEALEKIAPRNSYYAHQEIWKDNNGHSHIRASIFGQSISVPINSGRLDLDSGERIFLIELNPRPMRRDIYFIFVPRNSEQQNNY